MLWVLKGPVTKIWEDIMTIQGNKPPERTDIYDVKARETDKSQATEKTGSTEKQTDTSDKVNLSSQAKEISRLKAMMDELPDVRKEEVEAIKKAIETDSYSLDSMKIAEKILREM
jgi:negative regulator of flagellin synthesis FlgM